MAFNFCPDCGSRLGPGAPSCPGCGRTFAPDQVANAPPPAGMPMAPPIYPWAMAPFMGFEPPPTPIGHHKALAYMGGTVMLFTACLVLLLSFGLLAEMGWEYVEHYDGNEYWEESVMNVEYVMVAIFMVFAFAFGIPSGIFTLTSRRFNVALTGSILLVTASSMIMLIDDPLFFAISPSLGALGLALVLLARQGFQEPRTAVRLGRPPSAVDGYGWEVRGP